MIQTLTKEITLTEFLQQPETKPAQEYIDGNIYTKPMPQGQHSRIQLKLANAINEVTENDKIALAFPELRCTFEGKSIVPDVTVFTWEHLPINEDGTIANQFNLAPDWVIEILSPDQSMALVTRKIIHCLANGTQLGWLIAPNIKVIFTYTKNSHPLYFEEENNIIPVPDFVQDLRLTLEDIFGWLVVTL